MVWAFGGELAYWTSSIRQERVKSQTVRKEGKSSEGRIYQKGSKHARKG